MPQHELLRTRTEQHKAKNSKSKIDDKDIYRAMEMVTEYLEHRFDFENTYKNYSIVFEKELTVGEMITYLSQKNLRFEFDFNYEDRCIKPDGGILFLQSTEWNIRKPLIFAEIKRQGTNDSRAMEGKKRQAVGNAIERLGKNLTGIKAMMNYERITPFVCFGWGCDFSPSEKTVMSKISMLNEFYPINRTYVFKKDGSSDLNDFSPVSMYFREERWSTDEMFEIMKEIAETSFRYYVF